jgi:deoxyribonucleoside regulator
MRVAREASPSPVPDLRGVELLIEVATQFYLRGRTQVEIARNLGLDPSTISRHLGRARAEGIVRIEIRPPQRRNVNLARSVASRYGISRVVVAGSEGETLAAVAAAYVGGLLRSGMQVGMGWGQTLAELVQSMAPGEVTDLRICQLAGGLSASPLGIQGHELVRQLATLHPGSSVQYLHAPSIVDSATIRDAIVSDSSVQAALSIAANSDLALVGIGSMEPDATLIRAGGLGASERGRLFAGGAVGSMNTRFYDDQGQPVTDLDDRTIAISWEELRAIPVVIAVAGGANKAEAIRAALRTGCVNVLVIDEAAAGPLLD